MEPLRGAVVTDDPGEVNFGKTSGFRAVEVVHAVPDRLQDPASETYENEAC